MGEGFRMEYYEKIATDVATDVASDIAKHRYIEYSLPLVSVNISGTSAYFFSTTDTTPTIVDFTFINYGKVMDIIRNMYGADVEVLKQWIELVIATDTSGQTAYADLYNYTDSAQVAQISTGSTEKSNQMQIVLPTLDETKVYVMRGWSSDTNANCVIGTITFKQLLKFIEDEL